CGYFRRTLRCLDWVLAPGSRERRSKPRNYSSRQNQPTPVRSMFLCQTRRCSGLRGKSESRGSPTAGRCTALVRQAVSDQSSDRAEPVPDREECEQPNPSRAENSWRNPEGPAGRASLRRLEKLESPLAAMSGYKRVGSNREFRGSYALPDRFASNCFDR